MTEIFSIAFSLLFLSGYIVEPGDIIQVAIAGSWGLYSVTYLVNCYYTKDNRAKLYQRALLTVLPFVSLAVSGFVRDGSIISWDVYMLNTMQEHVLVNIIIVGTIGVLLGLLSSPIVLFCSHLFYSKTKKEDNFFTILIVVTITYFLMSYAYYVVHSSDLGVL